MNGEVEYLNNSGEGKCDRKWSRYFALLSALMCIVALLTIPLKIISMGYLPGDDALRHAGFAASGKAMEQVMVSDGPILDAHPGWHALLRTVHDMGIETTDGLAVFQVVVLFLLFMIPPLFYFKRMESWVLALVLVYSVLGFGPRLLFGRPFIAAMAVLLAMLVYRDKLNQEKAPWKILIILGFGMLLSIWWRITWFLYLFPIAAFVGARMWRAVLRLLVILFIGTVGASLLVGDLLMPIEIFKGTLGVVGSAEHVTSLVGELQPKTNFLGVVLGVVLVLFSAQFRGGELRKKIDSPVFFIIAGSCFLATQAGRWFLEFGTVAFLVFLAEEIDAWFTEGRVPWFGWGSFSRVAIVCAMVALCYVTYTADQGGRWSAALRREYVDVTDPDIQDGLPGNDGIIYSTSMTIFYQTFFKHPDAPWKYILGCEASVMPPDDLKILRKIQWNGGAVETYKPWVEKMRPQDRMWLAAPVGGSAPPIEGLEWTRVASRIWSGRIAHVETEGGKHPDQEL